MSDYCPIFAPFFARQRKALLSSKEIKGKDPSALIKLHLEALTPDPEAPNLGTALWLPAIRAASPLITRTIVLCSLSALLMLAGVVVTRQLLKFDSAFSGAVALCLLLLVLELLDQAIRYFDMLRRADIARLLQLHLIARVHSKISRLESSLLARLDKGNLKTLISSDVEAVEDFITAASANWIPTLTLVIVMTPYLYFTLGTVGLVGVGVTLLQVPFSIFFAFVTEKLQARAQTHQDALASLVGEWVRHIRLVRVLGWQDWIAERISALVRAYTTQTALKHSVTCVTYGLSFGWWLLVAFSMLLTNYFLGRAIEPESFFPSLWALGHLSNYVQFVPYAISLYGSAAAGSKRLKEFFAQPELNARFDTIKEGPVDNELVPVAIHLENVSVIFDGNHALDQLSCEFPLNKKIGIVGEVAAGKSILLEVLLGERFPDDGKVKVRFSDGQIRSLWDESCYHSLRARIAYCPAEPYISNASLSDNIDIWNKSEKSELQQILQASLMDKDVELFSHGLQEEIGELGVNLSGGQKQRTSLARAFLSGRKIFALDDPLSAVDVASERKLFEELFTKAEGMILVSHRLSELYRLDHLYVMENGKIIEHGIPRDLESDASSAFSRYLSAHAEAA